MRNRIGLLSLTILLGAAGARAQCNCVSSEGPAESKPVHPGALTFDSSDAKLVQSFNWAKKQALAYVQSGNDPVGLWYETGLPGRFRFSMRDTSHQAMGAQALGLAPYTHNMLRHFAENISASKDWCSYWGIDLWGRPATVDYYDDSQFWYDLPANFDVLDASFRMFVWTGDMTYINDPVFLNFYEHTVTDYVNHWQLGADVVMHRPMMNIPAEIPPNTAWPTSRGIPGYQENPRDYVVGIDLLAAEYEALLDYAFIEEYKDHPDVAKTYRDKAAALHDLINGQWWDSSNNRFFSILDKTYQFKPSNSPLDDINVELIYRGAAEDGPKLQGAVQTLLANIKAHPDGKVEGESHFPEVLYRYGQPDAAYTEIMDLTRTDKYRREYPEVSYSVVGAIVTGLMGINLDYQPMPLARSSSGYTEVIYETLPSLTKETAWAEVRNLPARTNVIGVRHDGNRKTAFTNQSGPSVIWQATFFGAHDTLLVDGKPMKAQAGKETLGRVTSWVKIPVGAGDTVVVEVPPAPKPVAAH